MCLLVRCLAIIGTLLREEGLVRGTLVLWSGSGIKLRDLMSLVGQQLHLLGVKGWGQLCGMRVLGGPLNVFL